MLISIAIPCYRSEKNLEPVVAEIKGEFAKHPEHDYQIILVNDGSPDHTDEVIRRICERDHKIVGVLLSRNFTQQNAKMASLRYVAGDVLVFMDDDGQHPADGIFKLVDKINDGFDVVYADFTQKKQSKLRILADKLFYVFSEVMKTRPKGIKTSSFVAYSRFAVSVLMQYTSPNPSPGRYVFTITTKIANVEFPHRERLSGRSGYNLKKSIELAITSLTNFTIVPLRIINYIGFISTLAGAISGMVFIIRKLFFDIDLSSNTSNTAAILFVGGLILISLGLVGEYIGRIYMILSNKQQFVIRETINEKNALIAPADEIASREGHNNGKI